MARVGGRRLWLAWPVGIVCVAVVAGLVWLALPALPAALGFTGGLFGGETEESSQDGVDADGVPLECRGLYNDALWAGLVWEEDSQLDQTMDPPATAAATPLAEALAPDVRFTCQWDAPVGTISTTLADVGTDAASIATGSLPAAGFACTEVETGRVRCERGADGVQETVELAGGLWLSTLQTSWFPEDYAGRVAATVWASASASPSP